MLLLRGDSQGFNFSMNVFVNILGSDSWQVQVHQSGAQGVNLMWDLSLTSPELIGNSWGTTSFQNIKVKLQLVFGWSFLFAWSSPPEQGLVQFWVQEYFKAVSPICISSWGLTNTSSFSFLKNFRKYFISLFIINLMNLATHLLNGIRNLQFICSIFIYSITLKTLPHVIDNA